jgi:hypothetical protein
MNIEEFKVQPATNLCMTDFATYNELGIDDVTAEKCGEVKFGVKPEELPLNYYDNDDGYYDNYIRYKQTRAEEAGFLTRRQSFMH